MSRTHDVAWAAGFFDGEGYVTIQRRVSKYKDKVYHSHYLRIGINHVNPAPLFEMQRIFGGNVIKQNPEKVVGNRKQRHTWHLSCTKAAEVLKQLMPYFKNKQNAAEIGLELQNSIGAQGNQVSEEITTYRELLKYNLQTLNAMD